VSVHIYLAFRFHGNFYHSYRGDTPDELGFGKDIRIIRHLIRTLDDLNAQEIPVCGTWDFENYFSLEKIMPEYCPDIITDLQRRVQAGQDDVQLMAYNNGLINAHTAQEFEAAIQRGLHNASGSGLHDLFGDNFRGMVRPQEMMYTPIHLKLYSAYGVNAISLYYSALPFNGFSNFIPPLSLIERYNPLSLTYPGIDESMTLFPCYNIGDLIDHLTLRRWVKQMRRAQLKLAQPQDLLLLIDMDADDEFWVGFDIPLLSRFFSTAQGLRGLVENVADLDYVRFTTPDRYLADHPPVGAVTIGQDTADGSFDGLSSWAEKWSNQRLWTGLERARILALQTARLLEGHSQPEIEALLTKSFEACLKILSTTHFGMAAPVMNLTREVVARDLVAQAVNMASDAFEQACTNRVQGSFSLLDYVRGASTDHIQYQAHPSKALVRLPLGAEAPAEITLKTAAGQAISSSVIGDDARRELLFVESFQPAERKDYRVETGAGVHPDPDAPVAVTETSLTNEFLRLGFGLNGQVNSLKYQGNELALGKFLNSGITYAGKSARVESWETAESLSLGLVGLQRQRGSLSLKSGHPVHFERELLLAAGLPYLYVHFRVSYPHTPHRGYNKDKAQRLEQTWDQRWQEVRPCEIRPALLGTRKSPLQVWKHNYCDHISTFSLDYGRFSKNDQLDSINNQITHAWLSVSDGQRGLLVAQNADVLSNFAFCPLRTRRQDEAWRVRFNPFGSYWGRQYRYATADTGLGNLAATTFSASDHINAYAPSFNGSVQEFSLLIAPYVGARPPDNIQHDAEAFAYPYLVLDDGHFIAPPAHRSWDGRKLGEIPDG
jgi:hypothetical protein